MDVPHGALARQGSTASQTSVPRNGSFSRDDSSELEAAIHEALEFGDDAPSVVMIPASLRRRKHHRAFVNALSFSRDDSSELEAAPTTCKPSFRRALQS